MSEEEIIDILENVFIFKNTSDKFTDLDLKAIQGLLDLYQKEKEKNSYIKDNYISKDKFKEFENEIYNSFDYDMGISQQFIDFLETNNIINRKVK